MMPVVSGVQKQHIVLVNKGVNVLAKSSNALVFINFI